ncbi:hypothetical protein ADICYQ_0098 [Cyclobacterium qasimii M12-11B]|nr:hypothetical protein ADICYQ_0098 [Cyclobacterium qasimii M12-11B]
MFSSTIKPYNLLLATIFFFTLTYAHAQKSSDLFLIQAKKGLFGFTIFSETAKKITSGKYYDNQPTFINKSQLAFTSQDESGNFDIIMYNLSNDKFTNMTRTSDISEFSPDITSCGQYISTVTVEKDSSQRLWLYPINFGEPELLYDDIKPVGYYGWHGETAALFLLGTPNRLVYPYSREDIFEVAQNPGRCIKRRPGTDEIVYLDKGSNIVSDGKEVFELKAFDIKNRQSATIGTALGNAEDFFWLDKNNLIMARDNSIYLKNISKGTDWEEIATLNIPGYKNISRITLSPDNKNLVIAMEPSK